RSTFTGGGTYDPATGMFDNLTHETFHGIGRALGVTTLEWDVPSRGQLGAPPPTTATYTITGHTRAGDLAGRFTVDVTDPGQQDGTGGATGVVGTYHGFVAVR